MATSFPHFGRRLRARRARRGVPAARRSTPGCSTALRDGDRRAGGACRRLRRRHPPPVRAQGRHRAARAAGRRARHGGLGLRGRPPAARLAARAQPPRRGVGSRDVPRAGAFARIAINRHGDIAEGYANNMRLFEATGVGALLRDRGRRQPGRPVRARAARCSRTRVPTTWSRRCATTSRTRTSGARSRRPGRQRTLARPRLRRRIATLAGMLERALADARPRGGHLLRRLPRASTTGARPGLAERPYAEQLASLMERRFGTSDAYSHALARRRPRGAEMVANCVPLQARWARRARRGPTGPRRGAPAGPGRRACPRRAAAPHRRSSRRRSSRPTWCSARTCRFFARADLDALRAAGRSWSARSRPRRRTTSASRGYDLILTSFPHFVERFRALGVRSEYLPLAFDERCSTAPGAGRAARAAHVRRQRRPARARRGTALLERVGGRAAARGLGLRRRAAPPLDSPLRARHRGEAWGLDMYRLLAESQRHAQPPHRRRGGPRQQHAPLRGHRRRGAALHRGRAEPGRAVRARARGGDLRRAPTTWSNRRSTT